MARAKYEFQTQGGKGIISVLMGGRPQVFAGIYVALKKPIIGFGPWARDKEGYEAEFYEHYASEYARALRSRERKMQYGKFHVLGGHSHMISFWTWFGIFGLIFWIYVLVMVFRLFKTNISAMPVFFGFICAYVPAHVWHILFSPFSARIQTAALITVVMLMNNEGRKRRLSAGIHV